MGIVTLIIILCLTIISLRKNSFKILNPVNFFLYLWLFIIVLSNFNLFGLTKPSNEAYLLILLMIIFFFLGTIINKKNYNNNITINDNCELRLLIIYVLLAISIFIYLKDCILVIYYLKKSIPMYEIRNWLLQPYGSENPILLTRGFIEEFFRTIIITPFSIIFPSIASYFLFFKTKNKNTIFLVISSIILLILSSFAGGGGRLGIILFVLNYILCYCFAIKQNCKLKLEIKKWKTVIMFSLLFSLVLILSMSIIRNGFGGIFRETYLYFAMPPTLLSYWLPIIKKIPHTYGLLTTYGIHGYFFRTLGLLNFNFLIPNQYNVAFEALLNAEKFVPAGPREFNAFVTPIYYFFIDGGYFFVCFASFIFGYYILKSFNKLIQNFNMKNYCFYFLIIYGVFVSFMRIQTCIPNYIISFIIVLLLFKKTKKNDQKNEVKKITTDELVSIVIPIYNAEKYLKKCLDSILNQEYKNIEVICVNDGSTDSSKAIIENYIKKDKRVRLINQKNRGVSFSRNTGIESSHGIYISFVDADDFVEKNYISLMLFEMKKYGVQYVTCGYNRVYKNKIESINNDGSEILLESNEYLKSLLNVQKGYGFVHMKLINKKVINKIRFNETIKVGEDALFNVMICKNVDKILIINKPLYNYVFNSDSVVRKFDVKYVKKYLKSMKLMEKYIKVNYSDKNIIQNLYNYIAYHVLLICVNYCYNPLNKSKGTNSLKQVCNIKLFKDAIKNSNYTGLSLTRKVSLFSLKHNLYKLMKIICEVRQQQFKK